MHACVERFRHVRGVDKNALRMSTSKHVSLAGVIVCDQPKRHRRTRGYEVSELLAVPLGVLPGHNLYTRAIWPGVQSCVPSTCIQLDDVRKWS